MWRVADVCHLQKVITRNFAQDSAKLRDEPLHLLWNLWGVAAREHGVESFSDLAPDLVLGHELEEKAEALCRYIHQLFRERILSVRGRLAMTHPERVIQTLVDAMIRQRKVTVLAVTDLKTGERTVVEGVPLAFAERTLCLQTGTNDWETVEFPTEDVVDAT